MSQRVGRCSSCSNDIYKGERSNKYLGHKQDCKNYGTSNLNR